MKSFYVECQLPQVAQAEISAAFNTFNETLAWIAVQVRETPNGCHDWFPGCASLPRWRGRSLPRG